MSTQVKDSCDSMKKCDCQIQQLSYSVPENIIPGQKWAENLSNTVELF